MLESRPQEDTQDFKWRGWSNGRGQKSKPKQIPRVFNKTKQNIPGQKLSPQKKIACRISEPSGFLQHSRHSQTYFVSSITLRRMTVTSDCFEYTKKKKKEKTLRKSSHPKTYFTKFSNPKKSFHQKFQIKNYIFESSLSLQGIKEYTRNATVSFQGIYLMFKIY